VYRRFPVLVSAPITSPEDRRNLLSTDIMLSVPYMKFGQSGCCQFQDMTSSHPFYSSKLRIFMSYGKPSYPSMISRRIRRHGLKQVSVAPWQGSWAVAWESMVK
jgi:hypothetical protein